MALLSLVPVLLPCQWCVLNWSWNPSFLWSWRVSLPFTVWWWLCSLPARWKSPQSTHYTGNYRLTPPPTIQFINMCRSSGASFTWEPVWRWASLAWQPVLRSASWETPVSVAQHSSPDCSSAWSWFSSSPKCWVSTAWLWPFTCTRNKSINANTQQQIDKRRPAISKHQTARLLQQHQQQQLQGEQVKLCQPTNEQHAMCNFQQATLTRAVCVRGNPGGGRLYIGRTTKTSPAGLQDSAMHCAHWWPPICTCCSPSSPRFAGAWFSLVIFRSKSVLNMRKTICS